MQKTFLIAGAGGYLEFDLYRIDSWDSGESLIVSINGVEILSQDFSQSGSTLVEPVGGVTAASFGDVEWVLDPIGDLGNHGFWYRGDPSADNDETIHVSLSLPTDITSVVLDVTSTLINLHQMSPGFG